MSGTILLADDSLTIQKVVELTFADTDYEVVAVSSGEELLERIPECSPDVVICDVVMPGTDGYEVCQQVKSSPETLHIPVILLTGTFEPFDRDRALAAGCSEIITKPFEARKLVDAVEQLVQVGAAAAPSEAGGPGMEPPVPAQFQSAPAGDEATPVPPPVADEEPDEFATTLSEPSETESAGAMMEMPPPVDTSPEPEEDATIEAEPSPAVPVEPPAPEEDGLDFTTTGFTEMKEQAQEFLQGGGPAGTVPEDGLDFTTTGFAEMEEEAAKSDAYSYGGASVPVASAHADDSEVQDEISEESLPETEQPLEADEPSDEAFAAEEPDSTEDEEIADEAETEAPVDDEFAFGGTDETPSDTEDPADHPEATSEIPFSPDEGVAVAEEEGIEDIFGEPTEESSQTEFEESTGDEPSAFDAAETDESAEAQPVKPPDSEPEGTSDFGSYEPTETEEPDEAPLVDEASIEPPELEPVQPPEIEAPQTEDPEDPEVSEVSEDEPSFASQSDEPEDMYEATGANDTETEAVDAFEPTDESAEDAFDEPVPEPEPTPSEAETYDFGSPEQPQAFDVPEPATLEPEPEPEEPEPEPEPEPLPAIPTEPIPTTTAVEPEEAIQPEADTSASLSDEDIERISQRVLVLATDMLEKIAWEVIPDMAEIIVRERVRELEAEVETEETDDD
ncbi:MAG: response regulator [bacterium]|nr:response regulator [bacterium]